MATPQLSPGVLIREVDLTVGRADNVLDNIGAIAGSFAIGPINEPVNITTEQDLLKVFGKPASQDGQFEYWMTASSYLSYGGILKVVRTDGQNLSNANSNGYAGLKIRNTDDYELNHSDGLAGYKYAAKTPGSWANNLKVCVIDNKADQILGFTTSNVGTQIGYGVTTSVSGIKLVSDSGGITTFTGYLKGIVTGITTDAAAGLTNVEVKFVSRVSETSTRYDAKTTTTLQQTGAASTTILYVSSTASITASDVISISGIATFASIASVGSTSITLTEGIGATASNFSDVIVFTPVPVGGVETPVDYAQLNRSSSFKAGDSIKFINNTGSQVASKTCLYEKDWYSEQYITLDGSILYWNSLAPKPGTSEFANLRNGRNDELNIVIIDDTGAVTGVQGNIIEKHIGLSKSVNAVSASNSPQKLWWVDYLAQLSDYVYVGDHDYDAEDLVKTGFGGGGSGFTTLGLDFSKWNTDAQNKTYSALGNVKYTFTQGNDYQVNKGMAADLGSLITSYNLFENRDEIEVDYLIMGPGLLDKFESQAKANHLISIANNRKDCITVISPHRTDIMENRDPDTQTSKILEFFSPLASSSYAVFDSGYKYTYDRFNNKFRYIPCNGDIAGLMTRTSIFAYPWFSPAGQQRGILNNAIKLAFNPNRSQRDRLYVQRVNSIINQPGVGILLYGDKTALGYTSAFDRINVRRLFLTVEQALERSAQAQLFELNDALTRANFVNIVEPYLRDVQSKRGIYGFAIICDGRNNTPDVIDNNEFRADIFLKPTKSINYVTLTFVATRTGISFEEVAGTVSVPSVSGGQ